MLTLTVVNAGTHPRHGPIVRCLYQHGVLRWRFGDAQGPLAPR